MNLLENALNYPLLQQLPEPGQPLQVADGVYWLRMRLPFALDHINVWLLEDGPGWTIIDCGISSDETRACWETVFAEHLQGRPVTRVLVTHCHPDHLGLADWLCQRWKAPLWMSGAEYANGRMMSATLPGTDVAAMVPHFRTHGVTDPALIALLMGRKDYFSGLVPSIPASYVRLFDQQTVKIGRHSWRVITGFGHSPEHVSLYCADNGCLISGDMLLPRISTNVSVWALEPLASPVQMYLDSLQKYADLPADTLVLPSHGRPFRGMLIRITQLSDHHKERLAEVLQACATPQSANDIVPVMFKRPLDTHQLTFALGEALAHCHYLWYQGKLERTLDQDGIYRFQAIAAAA